MPSPRLSKLASDYGGDLILPLSTLSQGGSKLLATLQLVGGVLITRVLGPLGAVTGIVVGIVSALKNWESTAQLVARSMEKAAAKEAMVKQFAEITKSVATAKAKLQDLFNFAEKSPFRFESVIEGGKALEQLTKGALLTKDGLALVGNVAAASGQKFDTASEKVGNFYSDLANGQPVRQSAEALRDMGSISQGTVEQIVALQQAGAGLTVTWTAARAALELHNGAMKGVSQTVEELEGKKEQTKAGILAPAGAIFNEGQKAGLEAQNRLLEKAAPALTTTAQIVARVAVAFGYLRNGVTGVVSSIPGLNAIIGGTIALFSILSLSIIGVSIGKLAAWALGAANSVRTFGVTSAGAAGAAEAEAVANTGLAASFKQVVAGATEAIGALRGVEGATLANAAATGGAGVKNLATAASGMALRNVWKLLGEGVAYLGSGLRMLVATPFALAGTILAALAVGATILVNKYESANEAIKDFGDATEKSSQQLRDQINNIQTAADQAVAYQKAMEGVKSAQDAFNAASAEKSTIPWIGGFLDMVNKIPSKLKAANERLDVFTKAAADVKGKTNLAKPDEQNKAELDAQLSVQQAQQENALRAANPEAQLKILQDRADAANKELKAKGQAQKDMAQQALALTMPQRTALASNPADEQKAIEDARLAERQALASAEAAKHAGRRVAGVGERAAAATAARQAAEAAAERNQALRNSVTAAQAATMKASGSEEMGIMSQLADPNLAPGTRQALQNQLALTQQRLGDAGGKTAAAGAKAQEITITGKQTASEQSIADIEAKAAAGQPLTPEETLAKTQSELPARTKEVEDNPSLSDAEKTLKKQELQTEIDLQKQDLDYRTKVAGSIKKQQDLDQSIAEMDEAAVGNAKDHWGALQLQVDAIQHRSDLTAEEKLNAIQLLKITQEQAAVEVYRSQVARTSNAERLEAEAAAIRGDVARARAMRNEADLRDADAKQQERIQEMTKENIAAGQNPESAKENATVAASALRQQDALQQALDKRASIPPVIRGSGGMYGVSQQGLYTEEQRKALQAEGISVPGDSSSSYSTPYTGGEDPLAPRSDSSHHGIGDISGSLDAPADSRHHGMGELFSAMGDAVAPIAAPGVSATDPLLKVNQDQLTALQSIDTKLGDDKKAVVKTY